MDVDVRVIRKKKKKSKKIKKKLQRRNVNPPTVGHQLMRTPPLVLGRGFTCSRRRLGALPAVPFRLGHCTTFARFFFFFSWLPLGLILFVFSLPVFLAADPKKLLLLPPLEPPTASPAHRLAALLTVEKKEAYGFRIAVAVPSGSFSSS